ncbi:MAG: DNA mismatch repair protein MutS, partial [bacterium]|nr:DNA mismatch repair protein MutS [bacterium]
MAKGRGWGYTLPPMAKSGQLTPMLRHYLEVKAQHPDAILFYRMGDFYELFFEDAEKAAPILQVVLTSRHKGSDSEVPMCGVPHHALDNYLGRALRAGLKVAICDQVEDPAQAKGLVRREVTGVVTPGTVSQPDLLDGKQENLLACLIWDDDRGAGAFLDVSTGEFFVQRWQDAEQSLEELGVLRPQEILSEPGKVPAAVRRWIDAEVACTTALEDDLLLDRHRASELLLRQFQVKTLRGYGLEQGEPAVLAAAAALAYALETQQSDLSHIRGLSVRDGSESMILDATTLANLEVFRNQREGSKTATLLSNLDRTVTPPGGRLLRDWLRRPLRDPAAVGERHDAVTELAEENLMRQELRGWLAQLGDPERLLGRAVLGSITPREAAALRDGLRQVPDVVATLQHCRAPLLAEVAATDPLAELVAELGRVLEESPPATFKNGGVIAAGVDSELDHNRSLARNSKQHILSLEAKEREKTGISSLKIRYNKVFGYYIEVSKANQRLVPEHYSRKQTLVNAERYVTPEVKELEEQILEAEEKQLALEEQYFDQLRLRISSHGEGIRAVSRAMGTLDVLAAFAEQAVRHRYCRPQVTAAGQPISIHDGRHPVVETTGKQAFVPNDAELDGENAQIVVLTGPNMGGKSTYLRQVALIVLMAQAGSFVPAERAEIGAVDRIFTRVGASDDLARGESTFMVEMIETANILHHAT